MKDVEIKIDDNLERIHLNEFEHFQGNLKSLDKTGFEKCKNSFFENGFIFPVYIWKKKIIDGHQRIFVLRKLLTEKQIRLIENGQETAAIPIVRIKAKNEKEARKFVVVKLTQYGKPSNETLHEFIETSDLDFMGELKEFLMIPGINMGTFEVEFYKDITFKDFGEKGVLKDDKNDGDKSIKCPQCGYKYKAE